MGSLRGKHKTYAGNATRCGQPADENYFGTEFALYTNRTATPSVASKKIGMKLAVYLA